MSIMATSDASILFDTPPNIKMIVIMAVTTILAFWLGIKAHERHYNDVCLDLGGGQNPGHYPICVIER
jgi:hypothetical protein